MRKQLTCLVLFSVLFLSFGCQQDSTSTTADQNKILRPYEPFIFRSVLDARPRMVTIALDDNLWAAYSANDCALYKVWKGNVNFDGAVYTTVHGPQPTTIGKGYTINQHPNPWVITKSGAPVNFKTQYRGHKIVNSHAQLMYDLVLDNGKTIQITEQPEYIANETGQHGFERTFTTANIPAGMEVALKCNLSSIPMENMIESDGAYKIINKSPRQEGTVQVIDVDGMLNLKTNETTKLVSYFSDKALISNPNATAESEEESNIPEGYKLIYRNDCKTCHNVNQTTIGPSYMDVARKYENIESNRTMLVNKVYEGGSGVWGSTVMNAHPEVPKEDITTMVEYIMDLDKDEEAKAKATGESQLSKFSGNVKPILNTKNLGLRPGAATRTYQYKKAILDMPNVKGRRPSHQGIMANLAVQGGDFSVLQEDFAIVFEGYLDIRETKEYTFRIVSDDGSWLYIDDQLVIDNGGLHGYDAKDMRIDLEKGHYPFRLDFFQGKGGKGIAFQMKEGENFVTVPATMVKHGSKGAPTGKNTLPMASAIKIPGDRFPVADVHPSYDLSQARPNDFLPKVGGLDFMADGRLVLSTWDAEGAVHMLSNVDSPDPTKITRKKIAEGLAEPLGLKVVDGDIYVLQKQELTKLVDTNGDDIIDEYHTVCNAWNVSSNFHEFAFGLDYKDGYFYGALAIPIMPGGASGKNIQEGRGSAIRISKATGEIEFVANGLRTPNGVGIGIDNEIFIADNQGDWLPASKIVHVTKDAWFGSRAVDFEGTANLKEKKPVVWLPQDEIGNSPSCPSYINDGPYKGQMIHGEVTNGGVKRVFVEKVNGEYQGAVFRFIQGLESGVNRLRWGPDGALYVGGIGSTGNWRHDGTLWYGLQRLKYNGKSTFEMLAVRAKSNGVEIEFTEPLREGEGGDKSSYEVRQWQYVPTAAYGGPKVGDKSLSIKSVNVSDNRKKVFLELGAMTADRVVYVHLKDHFVSAEGNGLWSTEAWYTLNSIPSEAGFKNAVAATTIAANTLSESEKAAGWKLLFDGKTTTGWRNFNKQTIGSDWKVEGGALMLNATPRDDGTWQTNDGGDIITDKSYKNYELNLEWKIGNCGNSGIIYNVIESDDYEFVWQTGPEMQVLDNTCHPDANFKTHRAGDLYDMIECKYPTVKPAGEWNKVRLIIDNGNVEHWLNGHKVVAFEMWTDEWDAMVKNSKFHEMKGFGTGREGHISLQDHGDKVWYRNIKIKEL